MGLNQHDLQRIYLGHAAKDHAAAGLEPLENVRRKHLTSAATWEGLARLAATTAAERALRPVDHHA